MRLLLVLTGQNQTKAFATLRNRGLQWQGMKVRETRLVALKKAIIASANSIWVSIPEKLYFAEVSHPLVNNLLSAKIQFPGLVTAFDAEKLDGFHESKRLLKDLGQIYLQYQEQRRKHVGGHGVVPDHKEAYLLRNYESDIAEFWMTRYLDFLKNHKFWDQ